MGPTKRRGRRCHRKKGDSVHSSSCSPELGIHTHWEAGCTVTTVWPHLQLLPVCIMLSQKRCHVALGFQVDISDMNRQEKNYQNVCSHWLCIGKAFPQCPAMSLCGFYNQNSTCTFQMLIHIHVFKNQIQFFISFSAGDGYLLSVDVWPFADCFW